MCVRITENERDHDREGATENEVRIAKRNRWLYRIGGVAMLLVTLNLTGII